jgi:hypothetical protein
MGPSLDSQKVICGTKKQTLTALNNCVNETVGNFSVSNHTNKLFGSKSFTVLEGLVQDPFMPGQMEELLLVRTSSNRRWLWLNQTTNDIIYLQQPSEQNPRKIIV